MRQTWVCATVGVLFAQILAGQGGSGPAAEADRLAAEGKVQEAKSRLAQAVADSPNNAALLTQRAQFLDSRGDPDALKAYQEALDAASTDEAKRRIASRIAVLAMYDGKVDIARDAVETVRQAGGSNWSALAPPAGETSDPEREGYGYAEIPGIFDGFLRMAALSTDLHPDQLLPALARNIVTGGYRTMRGGEALEETEYLKLLRQYLTQARELRQIAGDDNVIDIAECESEATATLLKTLGYRLRGECGPQAVLETVNPSRAFLSIDSAFPLAELEDAYRREVPFHQTYGMTRLPVLFGPEYWTEAADKKAEGDFIDVFLSDPALARLYVAMSKMHRPTATALRQTVPAQRLKNYANVMDFFGESFEIREGRAVVPGAQRSAATWKKLAGEDPANGAKFLQALIETDDGWLAAYYDALARATGPALAYFSEPARMERFYNGLRGRVTSPGPARPIFRATAELLMLVSRVDFRSDGSPNIPGGITMWRDLFVRHPHGKYDGKLTKSAANWSTPEDVFEALFAMSRKVVENEPLHIFLAITNLDRNRAQPLKPETVSHLLLDYPKFGEQFVFLSEAPRLSDETINSFLTSLEVIDKINNTRRRGDVVGCQQGLVALWQVLVRQGQIPSEQADASLRDISTPFSDVKDDDALFTTARAGVLRLLAAAGANSELSPQQTLVDLLAGSPADGEQQQHEALKTRLNNLFNQQRLVSLKTIFDLADHLERVSRGETFNVAMANRLAGTISEVRLPQSQLSTPEANAMAGGNWVDDHIRRQRDLNLNRSVDKAQGDPKKLLEIRGDLAPILRDTLVGLVYAYYAPPGGELVRSSPLFVRSHDFVGPEGSRTWETARMQGIGWPASAGGRLVGSLAGLAYALNDAEQNFLVPTQRQALIWQDLAPQVLLDATVPRWWGVSRAQLHYAALRLRLGRSLIAQCAVDEELHKRAFAALRERVKPGRLWEIDARFRAGRVEDAVESVTPEEAFWLAQTLGQDADLMARVGDPFAGEIAELQKSAGDAVSAQRIEGIFGVPHPELAGAYRTELLHLPLFPTMMGYSSRILAESWESTNLYWAALTDEAGLPPADMNLRVPEWTKRSIERIFATHLDDWPALLHAMRTIGDDVRQEIRASSNGALQAGLN